MPGYPIAWTDKWDEFDPSAEGSPYNAAEIQTYLTSCYNQFTPNEEPLSIHSVIFVMSRSFGTRRFWLWQIVDARNGEWFAVVGSGVSPFAGQERNVDRWIYAEANEDELPPGEFLEREIRKHG